MLSFVKYILGYNSNFYYLSLINENNEWKIHGLWPQTDKNNYPQFCKSVEFNLDNLKPIITELNKYWCSDIEQNQKFWEHEWKKHGSCMFKPFSEIDYFKKTLELYESIKDNSEIINKYKINKNKVMIPYDLDFNLLSSS